MLPCHVCGKDASTGWILGHPPAPDSRKSALCAEHDTPENRARLEETWRALLEERIKAYTDIERHKAGGQKSVTVHFIGGGLLVFTCRRCEPTSHDTLLIEDEAGGQTFIPIRLIKEYTVGPR